MARARVLLPLPDSPTIPTVSPGMICRLIPETALTVLAFLPLKRRRPTGSAHASIDLQKRPCRSMQGRWETDGGWHRIRHGWMAVDEANRVRVLPVRTGCVRLGPCSSAFRAHHGNAVAGLRHDAEIMGDENDRQAASVADVHQEFQDLRLDRDVERGGRFVGYEDLRIAGPGPPRSWPADACRRKARAGSCRTGGRGQGIRPAPSISAAAPPRIAAAAPDGNGCPRRSGRRCA